MLSEKEFAGYVKAGYNRIPLVREVLADLETPLSIYLKLAAQPYSYLLESVQGGEKWGRYSMIGLPCRGRIEVRGDVLTRVAHEEGGERVVDAKKCANPLDEIRRLHQGYRVPEIAGMPRFSGGLVGFFGYDTVRYIEPHLGGNGVAEPIGAPEVVLMESDEVVVFDNLAGRLYVIVHADAGEEGAWARGRERVEEVVGGLGGVGVGGDGGGGAAGAVDWAGAGDDDGAEFASSFPRARFEAAVERCREYIAQGDVYQVALSQRLSRGFEAAPLDLYRALRTLNPSPYMYYLRFGDFHIAGASPEIMVRLEDGEVTVRPIAGTRARGETAGQDEALAAELLADPKELAEHLMLIDLGRNDVGRVARIGTVRVTEQMTIERYSHVMHIVSNVRGELREGLDAFDVLKATFPAGTLSGAPKVRAMEIIEELEPDKRGIYSGAIGYIGWNGNLDTAIAIRTALIKEGRVYIQVGAGIVADSVARREWEETMNKGRAVFRAVKMAEGGLGFAERGGK